jgi:hypothetical protein
MSDVLYIAGVIVVGTVLTALLVFLAFILALNIMPYLIWP